MARWAFSSVGKLTYNMDRRAARPSDTLGLNLQDVRECTLARQNHPSVYEQGIRSPFHPLHISSLKPAPIR